MGALAARRRQQRGATLLELQAAAAKESRLARTFPIQWHLMRTKLGPIHSYQARRPPWRTKNDLFTAITGQQNHPGGRKGLVHSHHRTAKPPWRMKKDLFTAITGQQNHPGERKGPAHKHHRTAKPPWRTKRTCS